MGCFRFSGNSSKLIQEEAVGGALVDKTDGGDEVGGRGGGEGDVLNELFLWSRGLCKPSSANSNQDFPLALNLLGLLFLDVMESSRGNEIFIFSSTLTDGADSLPELTKSSSVVGFIGVVLRGLSIGHVLISVILCLTGTIGTPNDLHDHTCFNRRITCTNASKRKLFVKS